MDGKRKTGTEEAIDIIKKRIEEVQQEYERDMTELKQTLERLQSPQPKVVRGGLEGMTLTDGIHAYLMVHNGPVAFKTLMEALQEGGVRLGDPEKPNRFAANLKTAIANNRERFKYNRKKNTVRLLRPLAHSAAV